MSKIDALLTALAKKKLGAEFEQRVTECLENQSFDKAEIIREIIEHYEAILQLLSPNYQSVKLNRNNLLTIYVDDAEYWLDDKSSAKRKKAAKHRMAIECLLVDIGGDDSEVIAEVEKHINNK